MMTEDRRRMTADEMAVLREIVKWRRATGGEYLPMWSRYRLADGRSFAWLSLDSYATCMKVGVSADMRREPYTWHRITSVQQGVDLLVALGFLPMRFSTAYRGGWDAGYAKAEHDETWHGYDGQPGPDFSDKVPAVGPTW